MENTNNKKTVNVSNVVKNQVNNIIIQNTQRTLTNNIGEYSNKYDSNDSPIQEGDFGYVVEHDVVELPVQVQKKYDDDLLVVSCINDDRLLIITPNAFNKIKTDWKYEIPSNVNELLTEENKVFKTSIDTAKKLEEMYFQRNWNESHILLTMKVNKIDE